MDPSAPSPRTINARRWLAVAGIVIAGFCLFTVVQALMVYQTTGLLKVTSSNPKATLSITQENSQAKIIGLGNAKVRLEPGDYLVSSSAGGQQSAEVISIAKKSSHSLTLNPNSVPPLPSVKSITFSGLNSFTGQGLSTTQINILKQEFFNYDFRSKSVVVSVTSVKPQPHNPDTDVGFKTNFNVKIDSTTFDATISYLGLNDLRLFLFDSQTNKPVFDSGSISS